MNLQLILTLVMLIVGVAVIGWAVLWPKGEGRAASTGPASSPPRNRGRFDDVAELLESAYDHAQRQEVFGLDRRLEGLKTYLSAQAAGLPLPETEAEPPARPARKATPRKAPAKKPATPAKKPPRKTS